MFGVGEISIEAHCLAVAASIVCSQRRMVHLTEALEVVRVHLQLGVIVALDDVVNLGRGLG